MSANDHEGLWRHRDFLRLWTAQTISALGSRITRTVLPFIAILTVDASPTELGILGGLATAPGLVVGLLTGGSIDRTRKRPLLVGADLFRAAVLLTIPLAARLDAISIGQLYLVAASAGAATALFQIADNAYLPALISRARLVEGNAKLGATDAIAEIVGPGVAGFLAAALTAPIAIAIDAISYLLSAALLGSIRTVEAAAVPSPNPSTARSRLRDDIVVGFRTCLEHPLIRPLFIVAAIDSFFVGFFLTLYMLYGLDTLQLGERAVGLIIAVGGIGAVGGSLLVRRLATRSAHGLTLIGTLMIGRVAGLMMPAAALVPELALPLLLGHQLIGDAMIVAFGILELSLRQGRLPLDLLGRVGGTFQVLNGVLTTIGALLAGVIAETYGVTTGIAIAAVGPLVSPIVLWRSPIRTLLREATSGDG